ncbi:MAG TPA: hypothetical protein VF841_07315 [Anaeromyxobacter sp.]
MDAAPRSRVRRALPLVLLVALAAGIAAVALAGCGAPAPPRAQVAPPLVVHLAAQVERGGEGGVH